MPSKTRSPSWTRATEGPDTWSPFDIVGHLIHGERTDWIPVTLGQLLATWVAHDLNHLGQIARVMGKQYADAVGPWLAYLPLLQPRR